MKNNLAAQKPLKTPITLADGQYEITLIVKRAYFENWPRGRIESELMRIITNVLEGIPLETLARDAEISLYNHANRVMRTLKSQVNLKQYFEAVKEISVAPYTKLRERLKAKDFMPEKLGFAQTDSGMPLGYWNARDYIKKRILPVMDELAKMHALDSNDFSGRNSLRNLAEMEVRYHNHALEIFQLRQKGVRLVVSSVHADCSDRCYEWQGRVYSLDRTYGVTDDGRAYVPLKDATDIFYTTKAGRVYKNGLLGFNCRHKLRTYISGIVPEVITEKEQQREYALNQRERRMERDVRETKMRAELYKDFDIDAYRRLKDQEHRKTAVYKEFCKRNKRAFYPERLQVLKPSTAEEREMYRVLEGLIA